MSVDPGVAPKTALRGRKELEMATSKSFGYADSVTATKNLVIPSLSYATDFSVKTETANELVLTNVTSPLDQPETLRMAIQNINNIYSGTGIDPSVMSVSKRGVSLVVQLNDILRVSQSDAENTCCGESVMDFPISAHIVLKVPIVQYVDAETVLTVLKRNVAACFDTNGVTADRLNSMLRGALKPSTM